MNKAPGGPSPSSGCLVEKTADVGSCFTYKEVTVAGGNLLYWGAGGGRHSDLCTASVHS